MSTPLRVSIFILFITIWIHPVKAQTITQDTLKAREYFRLADSLKTTIQYDNAIASYKKAAALYKTYQLWDKYIQVQNEWGNIFRKQGKYNDGLEILKSALELGLKHFESDHPKVADSYNNIGLIYLDTGHYKQALNYFQQALKLRLAHFGDQHPKVATSYNNLGIIYHYFEQYNEALKYHEKSLKVKLMNFDENHSEISMSYNNIGTLLMDYGKYDKALIYFEKALRIWKINFGENHPNVSVALHNIGMIYRLIGNYNASLKYFLKSMEIWRSNYGEDHPGLGESFQSIGNVYNFLYQFDRALEYYLNALHIYMHHFGEEHSKVGDIYNNIALIYTDMRQYKKALLYYKKFQKYTTNFPLKAATFYHNRGSVYFYLKQYDLALEDTKKALNIRLKTLGNQHLLVASSYHNIGNVYDDLGQYTQALREYKKALNIRLSHFKTHHPLLVDSYHNIGNTYHNLGQYKKALRYYQKALYPINASDSLIDISPNPPLKNYYDVQHLLETIQAKASTLAKLKSGELTISDPLSLSLKTLQVTDTLIQLTRRNTPYEKDKLNLAKTSFKTYQNALKTALQLHQRNKDSSYLEQAFYFSERNRALVLLGVRTDQRARKFANISDSLIQLEKKLKSYKEFYVQQLKEQKDNTLQIYNENKLFGVNRSLDSLMIVLETNYPKYYQHKYASKTISVGKVQEQLSMDELLLEYLWGEDILYGFAITKNDIQVYEIPIDSSLAETPKALMKHFSGWGDPIQDPKRVSDPLQLQEYIQIAGNLYQKILAPMLTQRQEIQKLIIIPDGPLHSIPFDALLTESFTKENFTKSYHHLPYLIRDYTLRYGFSATLLFQKTQKENNKETKKHFAGFAPSYENYKLYIQEDQDTLLTPQRESTLRSLYTNRGSLQPLTYNQPEVKRIGQILRGDTFVGTEATKTAFKTKASEYRILHIAAHGFANDSLPEYSGIAFTGDSNKPEQKQDNFLQSHELYNMELDAELVVLSACDTGIGQWKRGEGMLSLGRAFRYAGCKNILMSQWKIDDVSTSELMQNFYQSLQSGFGKSEALRQAKLQYISSSLHSHPYYWAAYTLNGDNLPLHTENSYLFTVLLIGIGALIISLLSYWWFVRRRTISEA